MPKLIIPEACDVCGLPLRPGQHFLHHHRLGATWHAEHPLTDIKGEDVTLHTLTSGIVADVGGGANSPDRT